MALQTYYYYIMPESGVFINNAASIEVGLAHLLQFLNTLRSWLHSDWEFGSVVGNFCI